MAKTTKKKRGRPSKYSRALADRVCELVVERLTMRQIAKKLGVSVSMLFRYLEDHDYFREQYARAKDVQIEQIVDEMLQIADDGSLDVEERVNRHGETYVAERPDIVQRSRLMIDTRKWLSGQLKSSKYGDKLDLKHSGEVKTTPSLTIITSKPDGK